MARTKSISRYRARKEITMEEVLLVDELRELIDEELTAERRRSPRLIARRKKAIYDRIDEIRKNDKKNM